MLTIASLLHNSWRVGWKNRYYSSSDVEQMARHGAAQIIQFCNVRAINAAGLYVFIIRNNFEGMLCYFMASLLKIKAVIINIRDVTTFKSLLQEDVVAAYIFNQDSGSVVPDSKTLVIQFTKYTAEKNPVTGAFSPWQCAFFYFMTSGTTGKPKLVQYQETMLTGNAREVSRYLAMTPTDNTLCYFPVQYMYGLSTMLTTFISEGGLVFEPFMMNTASEILRYHNITTLPLIGDWMIPFSKILCAGKLRLSRVLNASDRLLSVQAEKIVPYCDVLWNNFGQTESGPRLFCLKLEERRDIEKHSLNCVVAPGNIMTDSINIQLRSRAGMSEGACQMFYQTPFAADGYVDDRLVLTVHDEWMPSGDLFEKNQHNLYYWVAREKNEIKINGQFVPVQAISNQILSEFGSLRHAFSKGPEGIIYLNIESDHDRNIPDKLSQLLSDSWHRYHFSIQTVATLPVTHTGKIKLGQD